MSELKPVEIIENYKAGKISKSTAIGHAITILENSKDNENRMECISLLNQLEPNSQEVFDLFENLLVSDTSQEINSLAAECLIKHYPNCYKKAQIKYRQIKLR